MMKHLAALLAAAILALLTLACDGGSAHLKVGLAYDSGGRGDGSFNDAAYAGVEAAREDFALRLVESSAAAGEGDDQRRERLRALAAAGCNPVIAVGSRYAAVAAEVAAAFPATSFALIDGEAAADNLASYLFASEQGSYLAGVIAATASAGEHVGFVGGMDIPLIRAFEAGFWQGALEAKPGLRITTRYLGDGSDDSVWNDPGLGEAAAAAILAGGGDVVYAAAGGSNQGVFAALRDAGGAAQGLWGIGVDSDQYTMPSLAAVREVILTSMLKRVDLAVYEVIEGVALGTPVTGVQRCDLARGGVGYALSNPAVAPYRAAADAAAAKIVSGEVSVATGITHLAEGDDGAAVALAGGDLLTVTLPANPSTGFAWSVVEGPGTVLAQQGAGAYFANPAAPGVGGAGGVSRFVFCAAQAGTATLRLAYAQPWDPAPPAMTYEVTVTVGGADSLTGGANGPIF